MKYDDSVIIVFAKAPSEGEVNTRLIPEIGITEATRLQRELIQHRLESLAGAKLCQVLLYCSPGPEDAFFKSCAESYGVELARQEGKDLGQRMANAIEDTSGRFEHVILVGTDAPALGSDLIEDAIEALRAGDDVVVVPAEDGGYVLIGMDRCFRAIFLSVPWGSERVLVKTRANAVAAALKLRELETCWDIDRPEDYYRWLRMSAGD